MPTVRQILKAINASGKCIKHLTLEKIKSKDGDYWRFIYSEMCEYGWAHAENDVYVPRLADLPLKHWLEDGIACVESGKEWIESRKETYAE